MGGCYKGVCCCRTEVGKVWGELASRDPSLLEPFERFLSGVMAELKQSQHDKEKLETHMKRYIILPHFSSSLIL